MKDESNVGQRKHSSRPVSFHTIVLKPLQQNIFLFAQTEAVFSKLNKYRWKIFIRQELKTGDDFSQQNWLQLVVIYTSYLIIY